MKIKGLKVVDNKKKRKTIPVKKFLDVDSVLMILRDRVKIRHNEWEDHEYMIYKEGCIYDESNNEMNISILMNNDQDGWYYFEN